MIPSPLYKGDKDKDNDDKDKQDEEVLIQKAVLSDNNIVMVIYGERSNLGYCRQSDSMWTHLQSLNIQSLFIYYTDIICFNYKLYALDSGSFIEVWDFNGSVPVKEFNIRPTMEPGSSPGNYFTLQVYAAHCYLVESLGDILLVVRYVDKLVQDNERVCSYRTLGFKVYRLNF
ncbi:hypothetical protein LguiB_025885 [Lonicera macranthoides]